MTISDITLRQATLQDAKEIAELEEVSFPAEEAATCSSFVERLTVYPEHFLVAVQDDKIVCSVNGFVTDRPDLTDEMYADAGLHDPDGSWQMIFGVATHPSYRRQGLASYVVSAFTDNARVAGRKGVVLTCKSELIAFYSRLGFVCEGVSSSSHGGAQWHQMRLTF